MKVFERVLTQRPLSETHRGHQETLSALCENLSDLCVKTPEEVNTKNTKQRSQRAQGRAPFSYDPEIDIVISIGGGYLLVCAESADSGVERGAVRGECEPCGGAGAGVVGEGH